VQKALKNLFEINPSIVVFFSPTRSLKSFTIVMLFNNKQTSSSPRMEIFRKKINAGKCFFFDFPIKIKMEK
jgi:hypothetical protein